MTPVVPDANPPSQSIVETFGFLSPRRHVRPHAPDLFRRSGRLNGGAVLACHRAGPLLLQADRAAANRSWGSSMMSRVFRQFKVTTLTTRSTAPNSSIGRNGAACPTGAGSEKIRNSTSG